jgi:glyoxylate reductase
MSGSSVGRLKIYVTSNEIPEEAIGILRKLGDVKVNPANGPPKREDLFAEIHDADAILCLLTEKIDRELLSNAERLKVIANMAVGYDNIDLAEATRRGIPVTNTPDVLTETTADTAMALILSTARRIVEADRYVRDGRWTISWSPMTMVGTDVHGKTLAIYGLGRIGEAVARRARGFDMKIIYHSASRKPESEAKYDMEYVSLEEALSRCDFLSIHVPLRPETRHSIAAREFSLMKETAYLINTSRGQVVDQAALIEALSQHRIAGAGLDVFEEEPVPQSSPLLGMNNVVLLPHIGSGSEETRTGMAVKAAENIAFALKGMRPPNLVNRDVLQ